MTLKISVNVAKRNCGYVSVVTFKVFFWVNVVVELKLVNVSVSRVAQGPLLN